MKKNNFYFSGHYWVEKDLTTQLNRYRPGVEIFDAYARPSHNKASIFANWTGYAFKMNGTRPSVQTYNTHVFTLAFFAVVNGRRAFCYITPSYNYCMFTD